MKLLVLITLIISTDSLFAQKNILPQLSSAPQTLQLFGEGIISTHINERDFAISPDGKEIYFTISTPRSTFQTIVFCKQVKQGEWTSPEVVSFAGKYSDLEPTFSTDGQTLYFASNRPTSGTTPKDFDIWKVLRTSSGWGIPENLGSPVNTTTDEFYPSITKKGNLYYTATYKGGPGREDIYIAEFKSNTHQAPVALDTTVNTKFYEFNAFVDPDERYILFTSYGRKDDAGGGDVYMSVKDANGTWQPAQNLTTLNSKQLDYCPYVSPDGKSLFITSERHELSNSYITKPVTYKTILEAAANSKNGTGNIYWIDFKNLINKLSK